VVTADEIVNQLARYISGHRTDTALWDFSDTSELNITPAEIKSIADFLRTHDDDEIIRKVALVGTKAINVGSGKLFAAFAQLAGLKNEYRVFRSLQHALEWLAGR
jgi:hypothetical protein